MAVSDQRRFRSLLKKKIRHVGWKSCICTRLPGPSGSGLAMSGRCSTICQAYMFCSESISNMLGDILYCIVLRVWFYICGAKQMHVHSHVGSNLVRETRKQQKMHPWPFQAKQWPSKPILANQETTQPASQPAGQPASHTASQAASQQAMQGASI